MKKSLLAFLLALSLLASSLPVNAIAEYERVTAEVVDPFAQAEESLEWLELDEEEVDSGLSLDETEPVELELGDDPESLPITEQPGENAADEGLVYGDEAQDDGLTPDIPDEVPVKLPAEPTPEEAAHEEENAPETALDAPTEQMPASPEEGETVPVSDEGEATPANEEGDDAPVTGEGSTEATDDSAEETPDVEPAAEDGEKKEEAAPDPDVVDAEKSETGDADQDAEKAEEKDDADQDAEKSDAEKSDEKTDAEKADAEKTDDKADAAVVTEAQADTAAKVEAEPTPEPVAPAVMEAAAVPEVAVEAGGVALPYKTLRVGRGESVQLYPTLGEGVTGVSYSSNKKKLVSVTADGVIKGRKKGTAYVTLKANTGKKFRLKVVVKKAPSRITANPNPLNLGVGEVYKLGYKTPAGTAAGGVSFTGDAPSVFSVNERTGAITALTTGSGTVTLTTYNGKTATCPVTVYAAPTSVAFDPAQTSVGKKQKLQLQMLFNDGAWSNVTFTVDDPSVAKVSATGLVTGKKVGQTVIHASTYVPGLATETVFTVWGAPSRVWVDKKKITGNVGTPFQLEPRIPVGSRTTFKYKSSKKKVATVSADGVVTPLKKGKTKITITTHNKKKVTLTLTVQDPGMPSSVKLTSEENPALYPGQTFQTGYEVLPVGADARLVWTSSSPEVATVDQAGLVTALTYGRTTIKAVSARNKKLTFKYTLAVQTKELTLAIPKRTTDVAGIAANLAMINAIKESALYEIDRLKAEGQMSGDVATRRKEIVNNIFENYAFPWMTPSKQSYWKAANSENGAKDFKADRVYYGMPYISGSGANRRYTAALAVSEGRYTDTGAGYYMLNKGAYLNGKYVGNDCSGLVNVSIWGVNSAHAADRTGIIAVNSDYVTIGSYDQLLPGDLICKADSHVVMFLYYASSDKKKIMIIENGGSEKGTNTVHCDIKTASAYQKSGYKIRRVVGL